MAVLIDQGSMHWAKTSKVAESHTRPSGIRIQHTQWDILACG
jgi:hypothetical protein